MPLPCALRRSIRACLALASFLSLACDAAEAPDGFTEPSTLHTGLNPNARPYDQSGTWFKPASDSTWHWQLTGSINTRYDVDLVIADLDTTPIEIIDALHAQGMRVICHFSAGSGELARSDLSDFQKHDFGNPLHAWSNERWLDITLPKVHRVMAARLDRAVAKDCDGVAPDHVDAFANDPGLQITATDQLAFNRWLFNQAHYRHLAVGLKNDLDQVDELVDYVDFAAVEQCQQYQTCARLLPFLAAGKPVLDAEFKSNDSTCEAAQALGIHTLILPVALDDSSRVSCDE